MKRYRWRVGDQYVYGPPVPIDWGRLIYRARQGRADDVAVLQDLLHEHFESSFKGAAEEAHYVANEATRTQWGSARSGQTAKDFVVMVMAKRLNARYRPSEDPRSSSSPIFRVHSESYVTNVLGGHGRDMAVVYSTHEGVNPAAMARLNRSLRLKEERA